MKRKKFYTFILSENSPSALKKFTVEKKYVHIFLASLCALFLSFFIFVTDYLALYVDQWKLSQLKEENKELEQKFVHIDNKLKDLERKVHQISDFSKKLQLITNSPEQVNQQAGFGKIHSSSAIVALSSQNPLGKNPGSLSPPQKEDKGFLKTDHFNNRDELEVRIERLKGKSELVKQDAWTLFTDLLEKQDILNNTPSILPVRGWVSSDFGFRNETIYSDHEPYFHKGVDIASTEGNPVVSSGDGIVSRVGYDEDGYGNLVVVDHGHGLQTYYAHLAEIKTKKDKKVQRGEIIGSVGSTGRSTGPHLHYEVRIFDIPVNPDNYILDQGDFLVH